jgi:hypothetical protein
VRAAREIITISSFETAALCVITAGISTAIPG